MANVTLFSVNNSSDAREVSIVDDGTYAYLGIGTRTPTHPLEVVVGGTILFSIGTDGSINGAAPATKGYSYTGTAPASVPGAGTPAGTFWSIVAPNGGASSGANGGDGGSIAWTTGTAGASFSTGANGGSATLVLGDGIKTGQPGTFNVTQTSVETPGNASHAMVNFTKTLAPTASITHNEEALSSTLVLNGSAALYTGNSYLGGQFVVTNNLTGTFTQGTPAAVTGNWVHNSASIATTAEGAEFYVTNQNGGTVSSGYGVVGTAQPTNGTFTNFTAFEINTNFGATGVITNIWGFHTSTGQMINTNGGTSTTGGFSGVSAYLCVPSQGGNTSGTNTLQAIYISGGGGTPGTGGTINNAGIFVDRITVASQTIYGLNVKRHGHATAALAGSTVWGMSIEIPLAGGNATSTVENYGLQISMVGTAGTSANGGNVNNYAARFDVPTGATGVGGTVTNYGLRIAGNGGTAGNWAFYSDSTANSSIKGSLSIGSNVGAVGTGALAVEGKLARYNAVATLGWGVPAIYGYVRPAQQTNTTVTLATYTVGAADGSFDVSGNINVTTATASLIGMSVVYTDETNVSRTLQLNFSNIAGVFAAATTLNTAGAFEGVPLHIRAKTGTTITMATTGTVTNAVYTAEGMIRQVA